MQYKDDNRGAQKGTNNFQTNKTKPAQQPEPDAKLPRQGDKRPGRNHQGKQHEVNKRNQQNAFDNRNKLCPHLRNRC
jgi:hypothetical protein